MSGAVAILDDGRWVRVPRMGTLDCGYEPEDGELPPKHWHLTPGQMATLVDDEETLWPVEVLAVDLEAWEADVKLVDSGLTTTVEIERVTSDEVMAACRRLEEAWDKVCEPGSYLIRTGLSRQECDELTAFLNAEMDVFTDFLGGKPIWTSWPGTRHFLTEHLVGEITAYRKRLPELVQLSLLDQGAPVVLVGNPAAKSRPAAKVVPLKPVPKPAAKPEQISLLAAL